jgi:hypothetical protein
MTDRLRVNFGTDGPSVYGQKGMHWSTDVHLGKVGKVIEAAATDYAHEDCGF